MLFMLAGPSEAGFKDRYLGYTYPPPVSSDYVKDDGYPALGPRDITAAVKRSEHLWLENKKKREAFIKEKGGLANMRMFSDKAWVGYGQMFTLWDIFTPAFPCPWEVNRIGRMADGGKYVCGLPRITQTRKDKCVIYSFGVERESSWEAEILETTDCEIWMYDFSVTEYGPQLKAMDPEMSKRAHFHPYGIGKEDKTVDGHPFYTLRTLMKMNGHDWIDILKVDVEGAEFQIMPEVVKDFGKGNLPFGQLLMEIHAERTPSAYKTEEFGDWWHLLEDAGLRAFNSELNYPAIHWLRFPTAMEMNFVNNCNGKARCGTLLRDV